MTLHWGEGTLTKAQKHRLALRYLHLSFSWNKPNSVSNQTIAMKLWLYEQLTWFKKSTKTNHHKV
ncbi:CLUMA_CG009451, isoform A [Clunio marinus]|uniref:CLUMA_CG009451, isoform A n=1 Tax=Clunio marinus TaxID=568069 RepID=A0A1J1I750_9DIPT|nr:CLUMA_CG009451, isoform A [Clunio marinus]